MSGDSLLKQLMITSILCVIDRLGYTYYITIPSILRQQTIVREFIYLREKLANRENLYMIPMY